MSATATPKQHGTRLMAGVRMGVAVLVAALAGCGGGGGGESPAPAPQAGSALQVAQSGDLAAYFRLRLQQTSGAAGASTGSLASLAPQAPAAVLASGGTVVQEAGVDEDDLIKTDGATVYALHLAFTVDGVRTPVRVTAQQRAANGSLGAPAVAALDADVVPVGMYLASAAGRLAVLGQRGGWDVVVGLPVTASLLPPDVPLAPPQVSLDLFALTDGWRPAPAARLEWDGRLVGTRMIGSVLYVVSSWTPDLSRYQLPANATREQIESTLAGLQASDLLPRIRVNQGASQPLVSESECLLQRANASPGLQLTTITAIDLSTAGLSRSSRCFAGGVDTLYMSPTHVYLASSRHYWVGTQLGSTVFPQDARTDIHKFALAGLQMDYRASGEVAGHLGWDAEKKPYRMSEHQGDLRVLSFTGQTGWTGIPATASGQAGRKVSPATLTVLREDAASRVLSAVSTLPSAQRPAPLGHEGEQVYAVHFAGPTAYVVTFRRTDPLYVLDLSAPTDPRVVGELTMPGYSDYLYPLANGRLFGVGRDATTDGRALGLKFALFDVSTPARPQLLVSRTLGDTGTSAALDYSRHGIHLLADGARVHVALPVRVNETVSGQLQTRYQGLARYTIDTLAGTLAERPVTIATVFDGSAADGARYSRFELSKERSVQLGTGAYYLSGGEVVHSP